MSIIDSIGQAQQRGANADQILGAIGAQNTKLAPTITKAQSMGADSASILKEIIKQNSPVDPSALKTPQSPTILGTIGNGASSIFKSVTKPVVSTLLRPGQAIVSAATGKDQSLDVPYYGKLNTPNTYGGAIRQGVGEGLQTVGLGLGAVSGGAAMGAGSAIADKKTAGGVVASTLLGGALGKVGELGFSAAGAGLEKFGSFLKEVGTGSEGLQSAAENQYAKVLAPTTKANKALTAKVVPEMAERKITAFSRNDLLSKAESKVEQVGSNLEEAWLKLPEDHKTAINPILKNITNAQNELAVNGVVPEANLGEHTKLGELKKELLDIAGSENAPTRILREYRQTLDNVIKKAGKGFGLSPNDTGIISARKTVANSIRDELSKSNPEIAKINNEFTFWKRIQDVLTATQERTQGQSKSLGGKIAKAAGTAIGFAKGGIAGAIEGNVVLGSLEKVVNSTAWNTVSAATKSKLADYLAEGDTLGASKLIGDLVKGIGNVSEKFGKIVKKIPQQAVSIPRAPIFSLKS